MLHIQRSAVLILEEIKSHLQKFPMTLSTISKNQELKSFRQSGHSLDFFIHSLMHPRWQICLHGNCLISQSSLKHQMQIAQVLELFFMISVFILFMRGGEACLMVKQGSITTYDIFSLLFTILHRYLPFNVSTPSDHFRQQKTGMSDYGSTANLVGIFIVRLYNFQRVISQRMQKNREIVLENPFHPLDLSPHDLLAIYKRFEQSRLINRNPKQELPIETIAQLISSLKGCTPSYIQRCISQALIKQTISWNEFLTFLDQESEVREKILEWLMYEKTTVKYKEEKEWPFRGKINRFYEEISFLKFIELTETEKVIICSVDKTEYYLFSQSNGKIYIIDKYINKPDKQQLDKIALKNQEEHISNPSISLMNNNSKFKKGTGFQISKSLYKHQKSQRDKAISSLINSSNKIPQPTLSRDEEQAFYKKQRKNINSLFNVFKDLSLDNSVTYAKLVSQKISEKNFNPAQISTLKEAFTGLQEDRSLTEKKIAHAPSTIKPLDKAKGLLKELHAQKRVLSYNPYSMPKRDDFNEVELPKAKGKRPTKERKEPEYSHLANHEAYNPKLRCLAIVYFNMQLVLIKILRQYNKISLQEQDKLRIATENEHKKNEVIQSIDFYYHSIVNKWFLIVLIRVQYKNELRNQNESYIRGYEIELIDKKARIDKDYRFKSKKQSFSLLIGHKDRNNHEEMIKHQIFNMEMQVQYGIHFISVNGKYVCYKEDYIESKSKYEEDQYFVFYYQEKFKNTGLSLSCLSVGLELNKIVFGTIRGIIIIYDMFSHLFKVKKISNSQISQIKVIGSLAYILTMDEKLIIYDLVKVEEIQHLSIKNQSKLHEKIKKFQLNKNILYFYGTEVRSYSQYVDEKLLHERRKMQTIYKWRLDKLFKEEASFKKENKYKAKQLKSLLPANAVSKDTNSNIEMVIYSENYFLVLTEILELIVVDKKTLKIKFTMILDIPHDSKVMKMAISMNEKLLALLLFNQNIFIFNIFTQDQYQCIKPSPFLKYTTLCFLDSKNQYLLASGTENGKIMLSPYNIIPEKNPKMLEFHKKSITSLIIAKKEYLVCCGEDLLITVWLLPFNILKHEIKLNSDIGYVIEEIGCFKQMAYLRSLEGNIIEINTHQGKLVKVLKEYQSWSSHTIDSCTGQLLGVNSNNNLQILTRGKEGWMLKTRVTIQQLKQEIKWLGVVQSQKAVIFLDSGAMLPWSYQTQKIGKSINLCQQGLS